MRKISYTLRNIFPRWYGQYKAKDYEKVYNHIDDYNYGLCSAFNFTLNYSFKSHGDPHYTELIPPTKWASDSWWFEMDDKISRDNSMCLSVDLIQ